MTGKTLRMPVSTAARKGVSAVAATAADQRVVLTSLGRPVAVVDSADRLDEAMRTMREASRTVVESFADRARSASTALSLAEVCARLGVDEAAVRTRAQSLRDAG